MLWRGPWPKATTWSSGERLSPCSSSFASCAVVGRVGTLLASVVIVVALAAAPVAAPAVVTTVSCGDRVTRDTRLTADVDCSSLTLGSAVFVVGDGITLDLNGHTIHGPSDPASVSTFGVVVRGAGVTVKGAR